MNAHQPFTEEQQQYLHGFAAGCSAVQSAATFSGALAALGMLPAADVQGSAALADGRGSVPPDAREIHIAAGDRFLADEKKLSAEEQAKRGKDPFQMRSEMEANAAAGKFPKGTDVFLYKYHGLFFVAPAQQSLMCRMRIPGGLTHAHQFRGIADLAERFAGGYADVTTRANLQLREIPAEAALEIVDGLMDLGIVTRGSGADNIRNITITPTAGIDPLELMDVRPLARQLHHHILQRPELYGLPRKFNIAFDGGGTTTALADTNDIGFFAVRAVSPEQEAAGPQVWFRMELGGITGHGDFARDTGILLTPAECIPVADAVLRVFLAEGDRTDRKRARLKYVLDRLGLESFLQLVEKQLGKPLRRLPLAACSPRTAPTAGAHIGFHPQKQADRVYVGVALPVGRLRSDQLRDLAAIAERFGSGTIRLTVWQNLLISDIRSEDIPAVKQAIEAAGLSTSATGVRSGLVACTGAAGCKFAAAHTKQHALVLADYLESRLEFDQPVNIHLTGCHHSCAQHVIGDIGLLATKVPQGDDLMEGYHLFVGGGFGDNRAIGRQLAASVAFAEVPILVERLLRAWQTTRTAPPADVSGMVLGAG